MTSKLIQLLISLTVACLTGAFSSAQPDASKPAQPFLIFPNTESPDGRYAIAWGLPKHPDVWSNLVFASVTSVAEDVENYVVDVHAGTIICKLECPRLPGWTHGREAEPDYWTVGGEKPNHHDLEVVWSPRGDFVLINHTWRWDCVTFCAVMFSDGHAASQLDLNRPLGNAVRNLVAKSFPRGFQYTKKDLNVAFSDLKQVSDNKFSALAEAVVEKYWSGCGCTVDFTLVPTGKGKILKLVSVHAES